MAEETYPREAVVDGETLSEILDGGDVLQLYPDSSHGTISIVGLGTVIRRGRAHRLVELHQEGSIHRGFLKPNQIMPGSVVRVVNSGGTHTTPVVGAHGHSVVNGDAFRERFRRAHTPRRRTQYW